MGLHAVESGHKSHEWASLLGAAGGNGDILGLSKKLLIDLEEVQQNHFEGKDNSTLQVALDFTAQRLERLRSKLECANSIVSNAALIA